MNAKELIELLDGAYPYGYVQDAIAMLRQQQADLKDADKYALELERLYEDAKAEIEGLKLHIQGLQASITLGEKYMARKDPVETLENIGAILRKASEK